MWLEQSRHRKLEGEQHSREVTRTELTGFASFWKRTSKNLEDTKPTPKITFCAILRNWGLKQDILEPA
jgi:hypothetical protein